MQSILLRVPRDTDGVHVHRLVADCPPLDGNSLYCNLLQCTHFADTCVAAQLNDALVGFVSGYRRPDAPSTLFIWQVAVAAAARGRHLALTMLLEVLSRDVCGGVTHLETTITPDNVASWQLFRTLAEHLHADAADTVLFSADRHFSGRHDSEHLLRIGPFSRAAVHRARSCSSLDTPLETTE